MEIGLAIADHVGSVARPGCVAEVVEQQAHLGLAAVAAVGGGVRAHAHGFEGDSLGGKDVEQQLLQRTEFLFAETRRAEPVLVGDHHEGVTGVAQAAQRGHDLGLERELVETVDLEVGRLGDERAVAVEEEDFPHGCFALTGGRGFMPRHWSSESGHKAPPTQKQKG